MFLVRIPISFGLGMVARKGAERLSAAALGRVDGVPGTDRPEAKDLTVKLRYVLLAAALEATVFAITKALADRGAERLSMTLTGKSAHKALPAGSKSTTKA
ncbi:MAG: DUF4235 domain-containing protein [Patulibacter sp.]|nr:DUF4235 domain-containing protein [Patulibacter sp.]